MESNNERNGLEVKNCIGDFFPHQPIQYIGSWCPLCKSALTEEHLKAELWRLKDTNKKLCLKYLNGD